MKILCLYNNACALTLFEWIKSKGHDIVLYTDKLTKDFIKKNEFDLTVSYTYRYILPETILLLLGPNVVNLHNSFLPWNRGADPNIWSIIENTPRGVTLHYIEPGLDKGSIIAQRLVPLEDGDTLKTSYDKLDLAAQEQFKEAFRWYPYWMEMRKKAVGAGSYHARKDGEPYRSIIHTYDMRVDEFRNSIKAIR